MVGKIHDKPKYVHSVCVTDILVSLGLSSFLTHISLVSYFWDIGKQYSPR